MGKFDRRNFLGSLGVIAAGGLLLPEHIRATETSGSLGSYESVVKAHSGQPILEVAGVPEVKPEKLTEENILGPYFRDRAPFRAKVTPALEPGETLVIRGRVWGLDRREPLSNAVVHVWQANAEGRYDNDDPKNPPKEGVFCNRARVMTDETGYYEYETIKPGRYKVGPDRWRPAHIHYFVQAAGYMPLVTQLYFKGDPENDKDDFIKQSLIIDPLKVESPRGTVLVGDFDIVLAKGADAPR